MRSLCWLVFLLGVGFPVMAQREAYEKAVCQPGIQNYPALDSLNLLETKDSMITELTYCTVLYPNGHKQIEGYKCRRKYDPTYFQYFADTRYLTKNDTVDLRVGWMKEYYKNGKISAINYLPYDVTREVVMTGFAEYGDTLRQYRFKISEQDPGRFMLFGGNEFYGEEIDNFYEKVFLGDLKYRAGNYLNGKKHGIWVFRDRKGRITTRMYINGKKQKNNVKK